MVAPGVAILAAAAIAAAAKGAGDYAANQGERRHAKRRAKEAKRETFANVLNDAFQRSAELESHRLAGRQKMGKRKAQSLQDTSDLMREAFNI